MPRITQVSNKNIDLMYVLETGRETDESDGESVYSSVAGDYQNSIGMTDLLSRLIGKAQIAIYGFVLHKYHILSIKLTIFFELLLRTTKLEDS
jgi:hypothetical protein